MQRYLYILNQLSAYSTAPYSVNQTPKNAYLDLPLLFESCSTYLYPAKALAGPILTFRSSLHLVKQLCEACLDSLSEQVEVGVVSSIYRKVHIVVNLRFPPIRSPTVLIQYPIIPVTNEYLYEQPSCIRIMHHPST